MCQGTILGNGDLAAKKTGKISVHKEFRFFMGGKRSQTIINYK